MPLRGLELRCNQTYRIRRWLPIHKSYTTSLQIAEMILILIPIVRVVRRFGAVVAVDLLRSLYGVYLMNYQTREVYTVSAFIRVHWLGGGSRWTVCPTRKSLLFPIQLQKPLAESRTYVARILQNQLETKHNHIWRKTPTRPVHPLGPMISYGKHSRGLYRRCSNVQFQAQHSSSSNFEPNTRLNLMIALTILAMPTLFSPHTLANTQMTPTTSMSSIIRMGDMWRGCNGNLSHLLLRGVLD
ncbi:hypothetical protein BDP27DRAFT_117613 [Rhodocollybia butyracea]|uniref:Uncharacterized protein n=1 Tax=Rhodocollybia butyracea TaxID=206335 RepID=A0A9P5P2U2_9AGAR|nr:hypothetical protein BDP27DRAFT_117613 [Rhodocollybia butyracea]